MARNLLDLNDDVLYELFVNLTDVELGAVASSCTRLQHIAHKVFSLRHKSAIVVIDIDSLDFAENKNIRRRQMAAILRNFGDSMTKLNVIFNPSANDSWNTHLYNLMVMYCAGTLETIELKWCQHLQPDDIIDATSLFRNVKEVILETFDEWYAVDSAFLSGAKQLTTLTLKGFDSCQAYDYLSNDYRKLQSLTLAGLDECSDDLMSLLGEFPKLRKLSIYDCEYYSLKSLAQLNKLTALKLSVNGGYGYGDNRSLIEFLNTSNASQSLEELKLFVNLKDKHASSLMNSLGRFRNLKHLALTLNESKLNDNLLTVLHQLQNLCVLSLSGSISITSGGLIHLVRHLPHLERLSVDYRIENKRMQLQKSTFLQINEIYRTRNQKLIIYNFDITDLSGDELEEMEHNQSTSGSDQQEFVQFYYTDKRSPFLKDVSI